MKKVLVLMAVILILAGCGKDKITQNDPTDNEVMAINLTMAEDPTSTTNELIFHLATDQILGCANFKILYDLKWRGLAPEIDILGSDLPDICATAYGPATAAINMGVLPSGEHIITINNGMSSIFKLIVTENAYQIVPEELHNLTINNSYLARDPG